MKWDDVNCASSSYLSIAQCSYSTYIDSGCTNSNSYDATVYCCKTIGQCELLYIFSIDSTRIWDSSPFPGMIRLQGGNYSNEGHLEVYCNGQWGTICSTGFGYTDANTICNQLGYDSPFSYSNLSLYGSYRGHFLITYIVFYRSSYQTVWRRNVPSLSTDTCFSMSNTCPVSLVSNCTQAATIVCGKLYFVKE